jgi:hypothetical protein
MKWPIVLVLLGILLVCLAACTASGGEDVGAAASSRNPAGFWLGLWHGCIAPLTFIISLFNKNVGVYEAYNNGGWYNSGFIFGLIVALGGGRGSGRKAWRKKKGKTSSTRRDDNDE